MLIFYMAKVSHIDVRLLYIFSLRGAAGYQEDPSFHITLNGDIQAWYRRLQKKKGTDFPTTKMKNKFTLKHLKLTTGVAISELRCRTVLSRCGSLEGTK